MQYHTMLYHAIPWVNSDPFHRNQNFSSFHTSCVDIGPTILIVRRINPTPFALSFFFCIDLLCDGCVSKAWLILRFFLF